ncbi:hypothetical protein K443DRAFT_8592 [Laccaria amethystina LaAM-08-1]|uniref:Uncharacterized protein n=1 Tax=Laccaria amethystina LaAM-08-1 TaxID=1095629 RepID=A0A0C9X273_9AGAR|nr:hypothetical protein K443DRAFT_8592 [Laccaria amethystina LaAM-08-1]
MTKQQFAGTSARCSPFSSNAAWTSLQAGILLTSAVQKPELTGDSFDRVQVRWECTLLQKSVANQWRVREPRNQDDAVEATWRMAHGTMNADEMLHSVKESLAVGRSLHRRGLSAEGRLFPCANDTLYTISLVAADWRRLGQGYGGFVG